MFKDIIKLLKINHYIKNAIVFVPIILSLNFVNIKLVGVSFIMFFAFCLISSAVYVMNDIIDIENDKKHPIKCNRPIASGKVSIKLACFILLILMSSSFALSYFINFKCFLMVILYFVLNIFYSIWLKHISLVDAVCIAIGFIFRIVAGCFAIKVFPSPLVILLTFFVSQFFTFTKRKLEIQLTKPESQSRLSIKNIDVNLAGQYILINAVLSISFYIMYVLDSDTMQRAGTTHLYLTVIPFTLIIYRLYLLVNNSCINDDPIIFIEQDNVLKSLFVFYVLVLICVLTLLK